MKKTATILMIALVCVGCNDAVQKIPVSTTIPATMEIVIIDSCEYIKYNGYGCDHYIHKGNCKNPIHYSQVNTIRP